MLDIDKDVTKIRQRFSNLSQGISRFFESVKSGPLGFVFRLIIRMAKAYNRLIWQRFARNDQGSYTSRRVSATIGGTILALWMLPPALLTVWQIGLSQATWKQETVFLTMTQEIDHDSEIHSVRGCRNIPCTEADAVYFRVRSTWLHDIYSLYNTGSIYTLFTTGHRFYPEEVASVVAPGVNRCEVTSYGIRVRAMMRNFGIYPDMLRAVCVPYNSQTSSPDTKHASEPTPAPAPTPPTAPEPAPATEAAGADADPQTSKAHTPAALEIEAATASMAQPDFQAEPMETAVAVPADGDAQSPPMSAPPTAQEAASSGLRAQTVPLAPGTGPGDLVEAPSP